jgi:hypothetical protein
MLFRLRRWAIVCCAVAVGALTGLPAAARDNPGPTKNFVPPRGVPDHFTEEAEPFLGRAHMPHEAVAAAPAVVPVRRATPHAAAHRGGRRHAHAVHHRTSAHRPVHAAHVRRHAAIRRTHTAKR